MMYWVLMILCLIPAAVCVAGAVMNAHFAVATEDPVAYETAARYWLYGAMGFVVIGAGFGVNAALIRRKRRMSGVDNG